MERAGGRYFVAYSAGFKNAAEFGTAGRYIRWADRVWAEDHNEVYFYKNRIVCPFTPVDLKEFFLIKLKCNPI